MLSTSLELEQLLVQMGQVGKHLFDLRAAEGAAGNLSACFREDLDVSNIFPEVQTIELPVPAPDLAGAMVIVSGAGRRLRDILESPAANLACIAVEPGGQTGRLFTSPDCQFTRVTSEFNSHLAVHQDQMRARDLKLHAIIHAQPLHLTYLSHLAKYQDEGYLNRHLLRWQPETIYIFPEGIGVLPFMLPGSAQLTNETVPALREHRMVLWSQHGVMARADNSILNALDLIEYAETAAQYEYLNLSAGGLRGGLSAKQLRAISQHWNIRQKMF